MRSFARVPVNHWDEFILTVCYLTNRTPVKSQQGHTPYEQWFGRVPDLSHLREIGCHAFVLVQNHHNPKVFDHSVECVLIGYSLDSKAYHCYHRPSGKVFTSFHVSFIESHQSPLTTRTPSPPLIPSAVEPHPSPAVNGSSQPPTVNDSSQLPTVDAPPPLRCSARLSSRLSEEKATAIGSKPNRLGLTNTIWSSTCQTVWVSLAPAAQELSRPPNGCMSISARHFSDSFTQWPCGT